MKKHNNTIHLNIDLKRVWRVIAAIILIAGMAVTFSLNTVYAAKKVDGNSKTKNTKKETTVAAPEPKLETGSGIVFAGSTSQVVYSASSERKLQPGNLTMLMTAMIVIDCVHSDNEYSNKIDVTAEAAAKDPNLKVGQSLTVEALIERMLKTCSKGAADLLVAYSASSTEVFVSEMNSKVISMRLMDTQFANGNGEYATSQYSTAYDCAIIAQYAMRYERIKDALAEVRSDVEYDSIFGCMTGAMQQPELASQYFAIAEEDGMELIVVMLGADETKRQENAVAMFKYGYENVTKNTIVKADKRVGRVKVKGGAKTRVAAYTAHKGYAYIPPEGSESLVSTEVYFYDDLEAPLSKGSKVGEYRIYVADELKGTVDLIIKEDVKEGWAPSKIYISNFMTVVIGIVLTLVLLFVIRVINVKKARAKRRERARQQKIQELARKQLELEEDRRKRGWTNITK